MSEHDEFARSLLRGEDPVDVRALTERVLRRDRRRIWFLGVACVVAWMAVVMLPWGTVLPMLAKVVEYQVSLSNGATPNREQSLAVMHVVKAATIATFALSVGSMFVAAISTVLLIVLSRRATLRQVNARLAEISAQIRAGGERNARDDV